MFHRQMPCAKTTILITEIRLPSLSRDYRTLITSSFIIIDLPGQICLDSFTYVLPCISYESNLAISLYVC